jgi:hypothetical protein
MVTNPFSNMVSLVEISVRFQTLSSTKTEPRNLRKPTYARVGKMTGREINCDNDGQEVAGQYCFR